LNQVVVLAGVDDERVVRRLGDGEGEGARQFRWPCGVCVLDGDPADLDSDFPVAVVADSNNHRLAMYRMRDGMLLTHIGGRGSAPGLFNCPRGVAVVSTEISGDEFDWLVVVDENNRRLQILTITGQVKYILAGSTANGLGPINLFLGGVAVCAATGEVWTTDAFNNRVVAWKLPSRDQPANSDLAEQTWFNAQGEKCSGLMPQSLTTELSARVVCGDLGAGSGPGQFDRPTGLAVTADLRIWVSDMHNHRVCLFR
jgi:hypothetical protein